MRNAQTLAAQFSAYICSELTPEQVDIVNEKNYSLEYAGCCATHDYLDSNQTMLDAFFTVFDREAQLCSERDHRLISEAWEISKQAKFKNR
jgi:hypothetical protein